MDYDINIILLPNLVFLYGIDVGVGLQVFNQNQLDSSTSDH